MSYKSVAKVINDLQRLYENKAEDVVRGRIEDFEAYRVSVKELDLLEAVINQLQQALSEDPHD